MYQSDVVNTIFLETGSLVELVSGVGPVFMLFLKDNVTEMKFKLYEELTLRRLIFLQPSRLFHYEKFLCDHEFKRTRGKSIAMKKNLDALNEGTGKT